LQLICKQLVSPTLDSARIELQSSGVFPRTWNCGVFLNIFLKEKFGFADKFAAFFSMEMTP
jgi:hypothetical protein